MGYVYFVWSTETHRIKIGRAGDPWRRFAALSTSSSEDLIFLGSVASADAKSLEREMHETWRPWRVRGEWFEAVPELVNAVEQVRDAGSYAYRPVRPPKNIKNSYTGPPIEGMPRGQNRRTKMARYLLARGLSA